MEYFALKLERVIQYNNSVMLRSFYYFFDTKFGCSIKYFNNDVVEK